MPKESVKTQPEKDGEYWEFISERRLLVRVHPNKRSHLFQPEESKTIPAPLKRIGYARTTIYISSGMMDFIQDNWKKRGNRPVDCSWTGKTVFRVFGPYMTLVMKWKHLKFVKHSQILNLLGKRRRVITWYHFFLLLAFVVCPSRTTKLLSESLIMENHLLSVIRTRRNESTCRSCQNSKRGDSTTLHTDHPNCKLQTYSPSLSPMLRSGGLHLPSCPTLSP